MPVQNGMGKATLDYIGWQYGEAFAVEAKAPGKHLTPRQQNTVREMLAAGATVFVIDNDEELENLERWLDLTPEVKTAVDVFDIPYGVK